MPQNPTLPPKLPRSGVTFHCEQHFHCLFQGQAGTSEYVTKSLCQPEVL